MESSSRESERSQRDVYIFESLRMIEFYFGEFMGTVKATLDDLLQSFF